MAAPGRKRRVDINVIRGPGGRLRMDFLPSEFADEGVVDTHVSGVARIARIAPGTVRVTLYVEHEHPDGSPDRRVACHLVWDLTTWIEVQLLAAEAARIVKSEPANGSRHNGDRRRAAN